MFATWSTLWKKWRTWQKRFWGTAFSAVNNQNLDAYRRGSALVVYKLSYKKRKEPGTRTTSKEATVTNKGNNLTKLLLKNDTENEALANKEQLPKDSKQNKEKWIQH